MKRLFNIIAISLLQLVLLAQVGWAADSYKLNVSTNVKSKATVNYQGDNVMEVGRTIALETWTQYEGYIFLHWTANGEVVSDKMYFNYTMPAKDVEMVAVYEFNPTSPANPESAEDVYQLSLVSQPAGAGGFTQSESSKVQAGKQVCVYATAQKMGFTFREWQIDGQKVSGQSEYIFNMPAQNVTLTAVFDFNPSNPGNPGTNSFDPTSGDLLLDDFSPGYAYSALSAATDYQLEKVQTLTMMGELGPYDVGTATGNCSSLTVLDVSRTTGMSEVKAGTFQDNTHLTAISLPATVASIGYRAFSGCTALTAINLYALTPPELNASAFGTQGQSIAGNVTIFVPASVLALYKSATGWSDMTILPLTTEVCDLEVNLPDGINPADYKDMYLEAFSVKSGQRLRYVITDSRTYTFSSVICNTTWEISLKNANDEVLGTIKDVEVGKASRAVTFESLKTPREVTLSVLAGETPVTDQVTITWTDKKGNFLTQGAVVKNLLEGNQVKYAVTLSEALAIEYEFPEGGEYTVIDGTNSVIVELTALPKKTINGTVTDKNQGSTPLAGAIIAVSQTVNGQYSKTYAAKTDVNGQWSLTVFDAPSEITASKTGYISQTQTFDNLSQVTTVDPFDLRDISGTTINLTLTYQTLDGQQMEYADWANVAYTVVNATTGEQLTDLSVQYPKIVMIDKLPWNTPLTITATSKNQKFIAVTSSAEVNNQDKADVTFVIKQLGGIKASYNQTDNKTCVGILYDAAGQLVKRYEYSGSNLVISDLKDGSYTLVTMANSQLFNGVGQLSQFAESGLRNGVDFLRNAVNVKSGEWTVINNVQIPYLDETKLYYTGANTSFTANKSQVTAGQYLTLRGEVDFKASYAGQVSHVEMVFDLTSDCEFVDNSVMVGKELASSYTLRGQQLIVPLSTSTDQVRFCVIPTAEGTYEPSASVSFTIGEKTVLQPIGSAQTTVKGVTLSAPATIAKSQFVASGTAIAKSEVYVYADDLLVGKTSVKANGKWSVQCDLPATEETTAYTVYARVITPQKAELLTDSKRVVFDTNALLAQSVGMAFYNGWLHKTVSVNWNMIDKKAAPTSYMFYTTTDFTFTIDFTSKDSEKLSEVQLVVYKNNNSYDILNASYNKNKKIWVASNRYSSWALPTAVKVKYLVDGVQQTISEDSDDEGIEHSNPILDPSGYVYEAVSSNRLQGVTASIYYKEVVEDQYGDPKEVVSLWDAEEYAQKNPLFTDENGMYSWDVPNGLWQVRLEKEGYLKTQSDWLPVPPPQLDINLPMTQMSQPVVKNIQASAEGVEIEFDKYMDPATLTTDNIKVIRVRDASEQPVSGSIELLNEEPVFEGDAQTYASKLFFRVPKEDKLLYTETATLTIKKAVESYAGVPMQADKMQNLTVEAVVEKIKIDSDIDLVNVTYGDTRTVTVAALPDVAAKGQKVSVESVSTLVATAHTDELTLDENGQAELVITGELPGSTVIDLRVVGTDIQKRLTVNVKEPDKLVTVAPRASRVSGSKLYRGAKIQLTSETEDAVIKYTLDGSDPTLAENDKVLIYKTDEPIVINDDNVTIKAFAAAEDMTSSETALFSYELKKSTIGLDMPTGWTWVSHNLENAVPATDLASKVERIVGQTSEVIQDPQYGFIGALSQMEPAVGYKIKVRENAYHALNGYELNANENTVGVKTGWNWIGYPLNEVMSVGDALAYFDATNGDMIVGADGFAEYDGTEWKGILTEMKPGQGYLFKTATTADIQFNTNYVSKAVNHAARRNWLIGSPWAFNKHAYPNIMPVTAEFFVDGVRSTDGEFVVAAFAGDECRGVGQWCEGRLMMNVYGNGGEQLLFKAYNKQSEQYFTVAETQTFQADNMGSWFAPARLTLGGETTGIQTPTSELSVTPAVARDHITVSAGGRYISRLSLTNMSGVTVLDVNNLGTGATVTTSSMQEGLYILTVQAEGKTYYKKILKANN